MGTESRAIAPGEGGLGGCDLAVAGLEKDVVTERKIVAGEACGRSCTRVLGIGFGLRFRL